ncbi:DUF3307 domain-containing protein [Clostridium sp. MB05]
MSHLTGDYLFQTQHLSECKGKDNYVLFVHSILYSCGIMVIAYIMEYSFTAGELAIIAATHFPIDYVKARGISPKYIGDKYALLVDQVIHYIILICIFAL